MSNYQRLSVETREHIILIGLDRAEKMNAFDQQMLTELAQVYTAYEDNDDLWCAVLYTTGEHFTTGLDLADVGPSIADGNPFIPPGNVDPFGIYGRTRTKPVIHASRGYCLTVGTELALASDICVSTSNTKFGQIEVTRGIMPFGGATIRLPQVAGWHNAMRYLLTGDIFNGEEAYRIGLVQELVDAENVLNKAIELAQNIASQAPLAVQESLKSSRKATEDINKETADLLMEITRQLMTTNDAKEGLQSFLERRKASFQGN